VTGRIATARTDLTGDVSDAQPAISLFATLPTGTELWTPVPDLLESTPFDTAFVAEIDNDQRAVLRFGDDEYGQTIAGATTITLTYRVGNGLAGNVGAEALAHVAPDPPFSGVTLARNPLPARDGTDPETIAEVQQWAPEAFRAVQFRAVTEADYARTAKLMPQVLSAVASFRWTGSWYTVFIGILPSDPADLINEAKGVMRLSPALVLHVARFLENYRLAGYDLEIRPPQFLALEIDLLVCAAPNHFRSDVAQAVEAALSNRQLPDGSTGFFFPGKFVFGEPVYLSQIYSAVQSVEGVDSVVVTGFAPFGQPDNGELARGIIPVGPWQIARLDNDPNFMERGVLKITMRGGKL
jgi:predicted phage baseplate assembly protein